MTGTAVPVREDSAARLMIHECQGPAFVMFRTINRVMRPLIVGWQALRGTHDTTMKIHNIVGIFSLGNGELLLQGRSAKNPTGAIWT